ncbi:winged helix-turn-helix transcriptional regulator [Cohnella zeiphila]|uniref:Helix-turn-helix transcriptional regulator n=1 Tax=Cohnella zeiphila TaxID=2761120 RepID=A0A7X0VVK1_9BACL|nr:helix-turn-helix domain-containing protein [Cohnella zeiphila]MBB6729968.1 helix-turn-helix transcriptional regulator [Cohnella zeiphila]
MSSSEDSMCRAAVDEALQTVGGKWSYDVISRLYYGPQRFNQLRRALGGITVKSLTDALRQLERQGVVHREVIPTYPVNVEYSLTEKGRDFRAVLFQMRAWGEKWLPGEKDEKAEG